jgi:hypothetical protein
VDIDALAPHLGMEENPTAQLWALLVSHGLAPQFVPQQQNHL